MFQVPLNYILINPAVDIVLFLIISYFLLFKYYKILLKNNAEKIMWIDFEFTAILLSLGYLNYSDLMINFFSWKVEWWFFIILSQFIIEGIYAFLNLNETREYIKKIKKSSKEKEEENLLEVISNMKSIANLMEQDLNKYKIQGNVKAIKKIEYEIEKIDINIKELEERLRELKLHNND